MQDSTGSQILEVNGHQVPAIAYKRIVELWRCGWTESEIIQEVKAICNKNSGAISEVVLGAINDQKFAFTFPSKSSGDEYLGMPLSSPAAIREAKLALRKTRTALTRAKSTENQNAIEALRLMEARPTFIGEARTYSERMERKMQVDQMIRKVYESVSKLKRTCYICGRLRRSASVFSRYHYAKGAYVGLSGRDTQQPSPCLYSLEWNY